MEHRTGVTELSNWKQWNCSRQNILPRSENVQWRGAADAVQWNDRIERIIPAESVDIGTKTVRLTADAAPPAPGSTY